MIYTKNIQMPSCNVILRISTSGKAKEHATCHNWQAIAWNRTSHRRVSVHFYDILLISTAIYYRQDL